MAITTKQKHKKFSLPGFVVKAAFLFVLISMLAGVISNQVQITEKKQALEEVQAQVIAQNADNDELSVLIESGETEMVERVAREEYGYAAPNERVFVDMSGK